MEKIGENLELIIVTSPKCRDPRFNRCAEKTESSILFQKRDSPIRTPIFLKNGQINRVTNFSSTFGPTESDSEKKLGGYLDSR